MSHFDGAEVHPFRVGLQLSGAGHHRAVRSAQRNERDGACAYLTLIAAGSDAAAGQPTEHAVRIQAVDLRDACRKSTAVREDAAARGCARPSVLLDIEVMIDHDAGSARNALAALDTVLDGPRARRSLLYVGTPSGLAGLIADIHVLRLADGVTLFPLTVSGVVDQILDEVLPLLGFDATNESINAVRRSLPANPFESRLA